MITSLISAWNDSVLKRLHPALWYGLSVLAYGASTAAGMVLNASYSESRFPVPYYVGQTTFDAAVTKSHYAQLIEMGTLDIFVRTQLIDFAYMITMFVTLLMFGGAAARLLKWRFNTHWLTGIALGVMWLTSLGPIFDALENAVSFVMLADPLGFPDWLIYPYSSFAVVKFALIGFGHVWAVLVLAAVFHATLINAPLRALRTG